MFRKPTSSPMLGKELLLKKLEQNEACTIAIFDSFTMYPADIKRLLSILEHHISLKVLSLIDCQLSVKDTIAIAEQIQKNSTILQVNIETFKDDTPELTQAIEGMQKHLENNQSQFNLTHKPRL